MSDSLGTKHDRIHQVLAASTVSLSAVEKSGHFLFVNLNLLLGLNDIFSESGNFLSKIFFINHIEACDELHKPLVLAIGSLSDVR